MYITLKTNKNIIDNPQETKLVGSSETIRYAPIFGWRYSPNVI
jgi:hypothetical protein